MGAVLLSVGHAGFCADLSRHRRSVSGLDNKVKKVQNPNRQAQKACQGPPRGDLMGGPLQVGQPSQSDVWGVESGQWESLLETLTPDLPLGHVRPL